MFSLNGKEYIGEYNIESQNRATTGPIYIKETSQILDKYYANESVYIYDTISTTDVSEFISPSTDFVEPTPGEKNLGYMIRYFVRRRNSNSALLFEINNISFGRYGQSGGIDDGLYGVLELKWYITNDKIELNKIVKLNWKQTIEAEKTFKGIELSISNFSKYSLI